MELTIDEIRDIKRRKGLYLQATEPLCRSIGRLHDLFFKGWVITPSGAQVIYHDGHDKWVKIYQDEIDKVRQHYFPDEPPKH